MGQCGKCLLSLTPFASEGVRIDKSGWILRSVRSYRMEERAADAAAAATAFAERAPFAVA
jgi:hypothetical protein